ncbi:MAG: hypothetical protein H7A37_05635 [Chlamydiales bacterium]|nr:hypothetical protein [Chlamydiales bacterium]
MNVSPPSAANNIISDFENDHPRTQQPRKKNWQEIASLVVAVVATLVSFILAPAGIWALVPGTMILGTSLLSAAAVSLIVGVAGWIFAFKTTSKQIVKEEEEHWAPFYSEIQRKEEITKQEIAESIPKNINKITEIRIKKYKLEKELDVLEKFLSEKEDVNSSQDDPTIMADLSLTGVIDVQKMAKIHDSIRKYVLNSEIEKACEPIDLHQLVGDDETLRDILEHPSLKNSVCATQTAMLRIRRERLNFEISTCDTNIQLLNS